MHICSTVEEYKRYRNTTASTSTAKSIVILLLCLLQQRCIFHSFAGHQNGEG